MSFVFFLGLCMRRMWCSDHILGSLCCDQQALKRRSRAFAMLGCACLKASYGRLSCPGAFFLGFFLRMFWISCSVIGVLFSVLLVACVCVVYVVFAAMSKFSVLACFWASSASLSLCSSICMWYFVASCSISVWLWMGVLFCRELKDMGWGFVRSLLFWDSFLSCLFTLRSSCVRRLICLSRCSKFSFEIG